MVGLGMTLARQVKMAFLSYIAQNMPYLRILHFTMQTCADLLSLQMMKYHTGNHYHNHRRNKLCQIGV